MYNAYYVCVYIYIYIERERGRARERDTLRDHTCVHISIAGLEMYDDISAIRPKRTDLQ